MNFSRKRILITAGPTWVPIDSVRVISNIATGKTGTLIARYASNKGARVTLLLGPVGECILNKSIRVIRFCFFKELKNILRRELKKNSYDIVIHSAAVSDFYPVRKKSPKGKGLSNGVKPEYKSRGKLSSDRVYSLRLVPLEKLIIWIRHLAPGATLVMFKLEQLDSDRRLIKRAVRAKKLLRADLVVANRLNPYRAHIINKEDKLVSVKNKQDLAKNLITILSQEARDQSLI